MRISDWSSDVCSSDLLSGAATDKVEQRLPALRSIEISTRIIDGTLQDRMMLERGLDAGRRQFVERIALIAPILEALEVAVEPCAAIAVQLATDHKPAPPGKRGSAGRAGRHERTTVGEGK